MTAHTYIDPRAALSIIAILDALPGTFDKIAERTGLGGSTVRRHLRALAKDGRVHADKRKRTGGQSTPMWVAGPGENAAAPARMTSKARAKNHRRRVLKAIEKAAAGAPYDDRYSREVARHMADRVEQRTRAQPNTWFGALIQSNQEGAAC